MGQSAIGVTSGTHTISDPIILNNDLTVTTAAGTGVALTGSMIATGRTITKAGAGSVQFQNVRAAALNVTAGVVQMSAKATPNSSSGTSVVNSLSIASGASLDLANNSLVIDYSGSVGTLVNDTRLLLENGQLTSSSGDSRHLLGYADNETLGLSAFGGQQVDSTSMLIKFTYGGDSNLDGKVDSSDFTAMAQNFNSSSAVWQSGDFNYDGTVNALDFNLLATNFGQPALPDAPLTGVSVPEPASLIWLAVIGAAAAVRRMSRSSVRTRVQPTRSG
jgi:hypothetical protein